uniref:Neural proliferation differentiation and control protein 1 n=1 Tax=Arion vulgaris TaxID=1028688 RepID=A0A0B7AJV9_9EUPU
MFWRYIIVNFLLVLPISRIRTVAVNESPTDEKRNSYSDLSDLSNEDLIDRLITDLGKVKAQDDVLFSGPIIKKNKDQKGINKSDGSNSQPQGSSVVNEPTEPQFPSIVKEAEKNDVNVEINSDNRVDGERTGGQIGFAQGTSEVHGVPGEASPLEQQQRGENSNLSGMIDEEDKLFIIIIAVLVSVGFVGLMMAGVCYYKFRKSAKAASDVGYPAYGVTGPMKDRIPSPGDRKLAQSAQMYHYQHQKQQMIAMEKANGEMKHDASEDDSEEDNVEGDYTVYECPGLAPTGEMEVRNPLFRGEETPVTPGHDITGKPHEQEPSPKLENQ